MNGIICLDKPQGFTSFDAVAKLRGILQTRRLGHGGTLDPMATGVLPIFVGNATKACDIMPDNTKSYRAGFRLGQVSDTQDVTGTILAEYQKEVPQEDILAVIPEFTGKIMQLPPMYSAVQVNGKRLYDLARQGIEVERTPREIEVFSIDLADYDESAREGVLEISCGKGTYIRTIINDIGERLGCGGIMTSLVRTSSGGFTLADCHTFEELQQKLGISYLFIAHDLLVVQHISKRIAVMYLGRIVETAESDEIINHPQHPYTQSLISAIPIPDPDIAKTRHRIPLEGDVPSPMNMPSGCPFRTRCRYATERCAKECPSLQETAPGHSIACWNPHY